MGIVQRRSGAGRRGLTVVELAVSLLVAAILITLVYTVWSGATRTSRVTGAHMGAMRSVLLASHALRTDLARMMFTPLSSGDQMAQGNLRIDSDGYQLQFHVPRDVDLSTWDMALIPVSFHLRPGPGATGAYQLIRKDPDGERPIIGCLLGGIHFRFLPRGTASPHRAFLQVTIEGIDQAKPKARFPASLLIPVSVALPPAAYPVDASGVPQPWPEEMR